jgi:hypothetical protein
MKNVLVRTKFYWSWVGGPVLSDNTMTKRNRIKGQTLIYKTLLRSIKIEQQVPHQKKTQKKTKLNSGRVLPFFKLFPIFISA